MARRIRVRAGEPAVVPRSTQRAFRGTIEFADANVEKMKRELLRVQREVDDRIRTLVMGFDQAGGRFAKTERNLALLNRSKEQIDKLLLDVGYDGAMRDFLKTQPELLRAVRGSYARLGISANFTKIDRAAVAEIASASFDSFANIGQRGMEAIKTDLVRAITGEADPRRFLDNFQQVLKGSTLRDRAGRGMFRHALTLADTAQAQIHRRSMVTLA